MDVLELKAEEQTALIAIAEDLKKFDPAAGADRFIFEAQYLSALVPRRVRRELLRFRRFGSPSGGYLIRGVPIGEIPPTPQSADHSLGATLQAARVMAILIALIGDQFGFAAELAGQMFQNISPVPGFEDTQQSISSLEDLLMHNETVFTPNRADYVTLLCVRQDHDKVAGTTLTSARTVVQKLTEEEIRLLRQPLYATTVDASFLRGSGATGPILVGPISVLAGSASRPRFRCDFAETEPLDPGNAAANEAMDRLRDIVMESRIEVRLAAGDLVIINNNEAFHGRTRFVPRFDGFDRWLLRAFVTLDLSKSSADRLDDGRIVDRDYSQGPDVLWSGAISA